jgi:CHAD domain-containing protein
MESELGKLQKPVHILRRSLKHLRDDPRVEEIHNLRICAHRVEVLAAALMPGDKKSTRRLLKAIRPVRKAAGEVRDMDVLAGDALKLAGDHSIKCLLEHLSSTRVESARKLLDTVVEQRNDARRCLKKLSRRIEKRFHKNEQREGNGPAGKGQSTEASATLIDELDRWHALNAENLHAFRIKVKELRYLLQLAGDTNPKFVDALGKVKEQIGDWHDWDQLARIAARVLDPQDDHAALEKIDRIGAKKFDRALASAQEMKSKYLS